MSKSIQKLAVVSINRNKYSETFIQQAFDAFPVEKFLLYGDYLPNNFSKDWRLEGEEILGKNWLGRPKNQAPKAHLKDWLRQNKVDAILANYGPSGVELAEISKELGLPLFVHFHGYDAYRSDVLQHHGADYPKMFEAANGIVAVSKDMHNQLLQLGAPAEKLKLLHYGVDTEFFQPKALAEDLTFLFVGRLVPKKSPLLAIKAFQLVLKECPDATLRVLGDGEMMEACKNLLKTEGLEGKVMLESAANAEQVREAMWACRALILPSIRTPEGDSEGTPLVMLEAGACGRAVIGSNHGGIPDVLGDGENGILVEESDLEGLANAMLNLAQNPDLAQQMGQNGRKRIVSDFRKESYHGQLWDWMNACFQGS